MCVLWEGGGGGELYLALNGLREIDMVSGKITLSELFCFTSEKIVGNNFGKVVSHIKLQ